MAGGGRKSRQAGPTPPTKTLVVDNGGYTIKAGLIAHADPPAVAGEETNSPTPRVIPNCLARDRSRKTYVGSDLAQCRDFGEIQFRRPVEKGYIVNWEAQREIWDHEFLDQEAALRCDPAETRLVLAEHPNSLPALQANCDQMVFEEFQFASYYRGIGASFNAYHDIQAIFHTPRDASSVATLPAEVALVIDCGYSHTTVVPVLGGRSVHSAVRRLDIGGKLLTNYLTRLLSLRHYDMRNDTYIVNDIKESACYVSRNFDDDLDKSWKGTRGEKREAYLSGGGIAKDYVLPDFHARSKGIVRDYDPSAHTKAAKKLLAAAGGDSANDDVLTLRNERFAVPELLFRPTDIGLRQPGIADLVLQSLNTLPVGLWPGMLANIVVVGGNVLFEGFIERLQDEIVRLVPDDCVVRVACPSDPVASTWLGGANLARHPHIDRLCVTKKEYEEYGQAWVARKFATGLGSNVGPE